MQFSARVRRQVCVAVKGPGTLFLLFESQSAELAGVSGHVPGRRWERTYQCTTRRGSRSEAGGPGTDRMFAGALGSTKNFRSVPQLSNLLDCCQVFGAAYGLASQYSLGYDIWLHTRASVCLLRWWAR